MLEVTYIQSHPNTTFLEAFHNYQHIETQTVMASMTEHAFMFRRKLLEKVDPHFEVVLVRNADGNILSLG